MFTNRNFSVRRLAIHRGLAMEHHDIKCDETRCNWFGDGPKAHGLTGKVDEEDFHKLFTGFHPRTGGPLVQKTRRD